MFVCVYFYYLYSCLYLYSFYKQSGSTGESEVSLITGGEGEDDGVERDDPLTGIIEFEFIFVFIIDVDWEEGDDTIIVVDDDVVVDKDASNCGGGCWIDKCNLDGCDGKGGGGGEDDDDDDDGDETPVFWNILNANFDDVVDNE